MNEQANPEGLPGNLHVGLQAHDGYAPHSHEVRPDHAGVQAQWPPDRTELVVQEIMSGMDCTNPTKFERHVRAVLGRVLK